MKATKRLIAPRPIGVKAKAKSLERITVMCIGIPTQSKSKSGIFFAFAQSA